MSIDGEVARTDDEPTRRADIPTTHEDSSLAPKDVHPAPCFFTTVKCRRPVGGRRDLWRRRGRGRRAAPAGGSRTRPPTTTTTTTTRLGLLLALLHCLGAGVGAFAPRPLFQSTQRLAFTLPTFWTQPAMTATDQSDPASSDLSAPVWDPVSQIYVGGVIPEHESVQELLQDASLANSHGLCVFGYGSLCWNPGQDGDAVLSNPAVTTSLGRANKYRRCWAQRSTDHRGTPDFPGIVCTLLKSEEVEPLLSLRWHAGAAATLATTTPHNANGDVDTLGRVYHVPTDLVEACLKELDYREKGGYARDVIDVSLEDELDSAPTQADGPSSKPDKVVRALLYRGTLDSPAMWLRPLQDLTYAAAIMSVAVGPSGENLEYLERLDAFLRPTRRKCATDDDSDVDGCDDTTALAKLARRLRDNYDLFFLLGAGSNHHNQLMLRGTQCCSEESKVRVEDCHVSDDEVHGLTELVAACPLQGDQGNDVAVDVRAGGGHTGILTRSGRLFLVGWNESGQLGRHPADASGSSENDGEYSVPMPIVLQELPGVRVKAASLGFSHTLVIEKGSGRLFGFGSDDKGQVRGSSNKDQERPSPGVFAPTAPEWVSLTDDRFVSVAAGVFHSAAVTTHGELCLWGCPRSIGSDLASPSAANGIFRWKPRDGSRIVKVSCGRRHTVAVDDQNRVWTMGDDRYGQLGRPTQHAEYRRTPQIVELDASISASSYIVESVSCGWSHTVILMKPVGEGHDAGLTRAYGWGRNDRGQLGTGSTENVRQPQQLFKTHRIESVACGSEFTAAVCANGTVWSCGWNEHGNLATGDSRDRAVITLAVAVGLGGFDSTVQIGRPPAYPEGSPIRIAAGGSHLVAMRVAS